MRGGERPDSARLRQRLWGAMVLVAIAVIGLPLLLDGSGSESRFRHVEQLREEPPRILSTNAEERTVERLPTPLSPVPDETSAANSPPSGWGEEVPTDARQEGRRRPADGPSVLVERSDIFSDEVEPLTAWVVQAGSFGAQENAIELRERLRAAGFPSFVSDTSASVSPPGGEDAPPMFRVQVGPMVDRERAAVVREQVTTLLGVEPIVVAYP